ncbi:3'-5' exonuclease [Polyangium aurulentum]|uniref:3'-5' exonuclease n=1 Tax=Polyangium aurulentum TaxID=2567896 RepID=UPI0010ADA5B7|nr:3'-5' exonuclease [Polyangium aurulentum]UQA60684.1 exonuclease domain-containing protein [Polyangium aurulentum]
MSSPAFYLVVDLEATCSDDGSVPREEMEIIEIGAVLVDASTLEPVREMQTFVRPIRHPKLTPFCTELTTITQADVDKAPRFPSAMARLKDFLRGTDALFCSWGGYDRNQLQRDARRHGVTLPLGADHLNLKAAFSRRLGEPREYGTGQALRRVGLSFQGTHHRAIDDARNIARLLPYALGVKTPGAARPSGETRFKR